MATVSFDEKVVVTDPDMVAKMRADLDDPTPATFERKTQAPVCTIEQAMENARKWKLITK